MRNQCQCSCNLSFLRNIVDLCYCRQLPKWHIHCCKLQLSFKMSTAAVVTSTSLSSSSVASGGRKVSSDLLTQLSNVLPTGTFLVFQVLAPLATNNGDCSVTEKVVTSITLFVLSSLCCVTCFTDSYKVENGVLYYGLVTGIRISTLPTSRVFKAQFTQGQAQSTCWSFRISWTPVSL